MLVLIFLKRRNFVQIVKSSEISKEIRPACIITDYPFDNKNIDLAIAEVSGRYPVSGYCVNEQCDEIIYIYEGEAVLTQKDKNPIKLGVGDGVLLNKGDIYFWKGKCKMVISCSPSWDPAKYKCINSN